FFTSLNKAKTLGEKLKVFASFRLHFLKPVVAIEQGLTDSYCGFNMGQTAELLARELHISREEQDFFANESHQKAVKAIQNGFFQKEIMPFLQGKKGDKILPTDSGPRAQSTIQSLAKLRPYFEKETGTVTVGNSCPLTDGASACLMVSEEALKKYKLTPLAILKDITFAGLDPKRMGLGPVVATQKICRKSNISLSDVDLFEINEAFSAQVLACLKIFKHKELALKMGLSQDFLQEIPSEKLNIHGGAIALGHPIGSTGSRLVVTLMHALKQKKLKTGIASLCIGGGQGGAALVEMI
ncbi:MAG: thiolase family protein, partial [Bacteriovoracaceae bacterium]|nr:thiolase family protein [Bacteriovoracaceae bacterium]